MTEVSEQMQFPDNFCLYLEEKKVDIKVRKKKEFLSHLEAKQSFQNLKQLYDYVTSCLQENNFTRLLIFKEGIQPCWEDKRNKRGGNFTYYFDKPEDNQEKFLTFLRLVFQDKIMEYDELCGVIFSRESNYFQIWHADVTKEEALTSKLSTIIRGYNLMKYRIHKKCIALNWLPVTQQKRTSMPDKNGELDKIQQRKRRNTFPGARAEFRPEINRDVEETSPLAMRSPPPTEHGLLPTPDIRPIASSVSCPPALQAPSISPLQTRPTSVVPKLVVSEGESCAQTPADASSIKPDTAVKIRTGRSKSKAEPKRNEATVTDIKNKTPEPFRSAAAVSEVGPEIKSQGKGKRKSKDSLSEQKFDSATEKLQDQPTSSPVVAKATISSVTVESPSAELSASQPSTPTSLGEPVDALKVNSAEQTEQGSKKEIQNIKVETKATRKNETGTNQEKRSSVTSPAQPQAQLLSEPQTISRSLTLTGSAAGLSSSISVVKPKPSNWLTDQQSKALLAVLIVLLVSLLVRFN